MIFNPTLYLPGLGASLKKTRHVDKNAGQNGGNYETQWPRGVDVFAPVKVGLADGKVSEITYRVFLVTTAEMMIFLYCNTRKKMSQKAFMFTITFRKPVLSWDRWMQPVRFCTADSENKGKCPAKLWGNSFRMRVVRLPESQILYGLNRW